MTEKKLMREITYSALLIGLHAIYITVNAIMLNKMKKNRTDEDA